MSDLELLKFILGKTPEWFVMALIVIMVFKNLRKSGNLEKNIGDAAFIKDKVDWHDSRIKQLEIEMSHRKREIDKAHLRIDLLKREGSL